MMFLVGNLLEAFLSCMAPAIRFCLVLSLMAQLITSAAAEETKMEDPNRIAFSVFQDGEWDLYSSKVDGTDLKQITSDALREVAPLWSPNGKLLAFSYGVPMGPGVTVGFGSEGLYLVNATKSDLLKISNDRVIAPKFSQDSQFISYFTGQEPWIGFFCTYEKLTLHIVEVRSGREVVQLPDLSHAIWLNDSNTVLWRDAEGNLGVTSPFDQVTVAFDRPAFGERPPVPLLSSPDGSKIYWLGSATDQSDGKLYETERDGSNARDLFELPFGFIRFAISDYWGCYAPRRFVANWSPSGLQLLLTKLDPITPDTEFPIEDPLNLDISLFNLTVVEFAGEKATAKDIPYTKLLLEPYQLEKMRSDANVREPNLHGHIRESTIGVADSYWAPDGKGIIYAIQSLWGWKLQSFNIETGSKANLFPQFSPDQIAFLACCGW